MGKITKWVVFVFVVLIIAGGTYHTQPKNLEFDSFDSFNIVEDYCCSVFSETEGEIVYFYSLSETCGVAEDTMCVGDCPQRSDGCTFDMEVR